jgi:hypothetical protein
VRVKQCNPLPNETKSHGLLFAQISVSQVTNFSNSTTRVEFCTSLLVQIAILCKIIKIPLFLLWGSIVGGVLSSVTLSATG